MPPKLNNTPDGLPTKKETCQSQSSVGQMVGAPAQNWVNEIIDKAVREVKSWPEWMKEGEVRCR
jgi:hypothetical protein